MATNLFYQGGRPTRQGALDTSRAAAYRPGGIPLNRDESLKSSRKAAKAFGTKKPEAPDYLNDPYAPAVGTARMTEVGPMFMNQRYGPGNMMNMGPMGTMQNTGMGFTGQLPSFGGMFRQMGPGGGGGMGMRLGPEIGMDMTGSGAEREGMHPLEKAYLLTSGLGAVSDIYGGYQEGKRRDREYEDEQDRRKRGGALFGEIFRNTYGGGG